MSSQEKVKKAGKKWKEIVEEPPKVSASELMRDHDFVGTLTKRGGSIKTWHERLCILHQGKLYYYVSQKDTKPKGMINVQGLTCQTAEMNYKKKFGIKIISPHRTYYLACEDENDQERWVKEINDSSIRNSDYRLHVVDPDFSEDCTFHDLQRAIDFAREGDHVVLRSGVYKVTDTLVIKKPVTIRGVYPDSSLVHISSATNSKPILRVDSFNENLTTNTQQQQQLLMEKQRLGLDVGSGGGADNGSGSGSVKFEHVTLTQNAPKDSILFYDTASCLEIVSGSCILQHVHVRASYGIGISVRNRLYTPSTPTSTTTTPTGTASTTTSEVNVISEAEAETTVNTDVALEQQPQQQQHSNNTTNTTTQKQKIKSEPSKLIMQECHVEFNKVHGIKFENDTLGEITKCIFQKNDGNAIQCQDESSVRIERSVFSGHSRNAIYLESSRQSTIYGNKMQLNGPGGKSHIFIAEDAAPCASEENDFL